MRTAHHLFVTATLATLTLTGCQQQDDHHPAVPSAAATATAQESNSAVESLSLSSTIATDAILSAGSGENVATSDSEASSKSVSTSGSASGRTAGTGFTFATSGTITVDLDEALTGGGDRYPNATGTFSITYDSSGSGGPVIGTPVGTAGIVAYTVTVTALTPCTFTDPRCSASTTIATGASYSYDVEITWNKVDANHWTLHSDTHLSSTGLAGSGSRLGVTWSATLSGSRHAVNDLGYVNGTLTLTRTVSGDWTIATVRNGTPHTVIWHRPSLDSIFITVDGTTYGPYTLAQVWWYWQVSCH